MKKKTNKPKPKSKKPVHSRGLPTDLSRRSSLWSIRNGAIALAVVGVGGIFSVRAVQATIAEQNLDRIGNGVPTIVQIHDPQCRLCVTLQRRTRSALKSIEDGKLTYLVANINTPEGSALARTHGVSNVTLLLFDARGSLKIVLNGLREVDELQAEFENHLAAIGSR